MKKFHVILLIVAMIVVAASGCGVGNNDNTPDTESASAPSKANTEIQIIIDGEQLEFTGQSGEPFIDENNRTQAPSQLALESYGAEVTWDEMAKTVTAIKGGVTVEIPIGEDYIIKDGEQIEIDAAAQIKDDKAYLPVKHVFEALGADVSWEKESRTVNISSEDRVLYIHFIDVGQGDAIFIDYGEYEILIDGGNRKDGKIVAKYIEPYVDGAIELVVATHMDSDHYAGLIELIPMFDIDTILYNGSEKDNATCKNFHSVADANDGMYYAAVGQTIKVDDAFSVKIIPPVKSYKDENENSVVIELAYNDVKMLFTGDMEKNSEKDLLNQFSKIDVLKSSHHGSRTSSTAAFLDITKPDYVIISCGIDKSAGNTYGHPHLAALQRYLDIGTTVYSTHRDGTIIIDTDGKTYNLTAETPLTLFDAGDGKPELDQPTIMYVGNKSSKKFHTLDCESVAQISEKNTVYFFTFDGTKGYDPCGTCKPQPANGVSGKRLVERYSLAYEYYKIGVQ